MQTYEITKDEFNLAVANGYAGLDHTGQYVMVWTGNKLEKRKAKFVTKAA